MSSNSMFLGEIKNFIGVKQTRAKQKATLNEIETQKEVEQEKLVMTYTKKR